MGIALVMILICATPSLAQNLDDLIARLANNDFRASMELERMGVDAIPALEAAFGDPDYQGKLNVVHLLGRMALPETIPLLTKALDSDTRTRNAAIDALMKIEAVPITEIAADLIEAEKDYADIVLTLFEAAIANQHDVVTILNELLTGVKISSENLVVATRVANVLSSLYVTADLEAREGITNILKTMAESSEAEIRVLAINGFLKITELASGIGKKDELAPKNITDILVVALGDDDELFETRILAANALGILVPEDPQVVQAFAQILVDESYLDHQLANEMEQAAVIALERAGGLALPYVEELLAVIPNLDENTQWRLARVFVESGKLDQNVVLKIVDYLEAPQSESTQFYLVRVIGAIGTNGSVARETLNNLQSGNLSSELYSAVTHALNQIN